MARGSVVVTGAAQGIGRGIVAHLLECGYAVVALDRDAAGLAQLEAFQRGGRLSVCVCDVAEPAQVERSFAEIGAAHGELSGLVNNAAIADPGNTHPVELPIEQFRRVLAVNLEGVFSCTQRAVPLMRGGGAIVNIASTRALQSEAHTEAYAASKGGVVALTHALSVSLGPRIRVNAISPGWIDTSECVGNGEPAEYSAADHGQHPVGRIGTPADIAALTEFLLSERAGFVTGQNWVVDGGMSKRMIYV